MVRRGPSRPRQQSSLEFITTYSWALLIIALFVAVVAALALSPSPSQYLPAQCNIAPLLPCLSSALSYNSTSPITFTIQFQNNLGQGMYVPMGAFFVSTTNIGVRGQQLSIGSCNPQFLPSGTQAVCTAQVSGNLKPSSGTSSQTKFWVSYLLCTGSSLSGCNLHPTNGISNDIYNTGGISLQKLGQSTTSFYSVTLDTQPSGVIVINGAAYASGTSANLLAGNYSVFAQPSLGYTFSSWSVNAPSSVASSTSQSTTLVLNSNTTLTATFNSVAPTTSVTYTSTITGSPSSTSTSTTSPTSTTTVTTTSTSATTTTSTSTYTTTVSSTTYTTVTTVTTVSTVASTCPTYSPGYPPPGCLYPSSYCSIIEVTCSGTTRCAGYDNCPAS